MSLGHSYVGVSQIPLTSFAVFMAWTPEKDFPFEEEFPKFRRLRYLFRALDARHITPHKFRRHLTCFMSSALLVKIVSQLPATS